MYFITQYLNHIIAKLKKENTFVRQKKKKKSYNVFIMYDYFSTIYDKTLLTLCLNILYL